MKNILTNFLIYNGIFHIIICLIVPLVPVPQAHVFTVDEQLVAPVLCSLLITLGEILSFVLEKYFDIEI